jgi:uncharacterized membrane protein YphA (DoxX/SURF4 family)
VANINWTRLRWPPQWLGKAPWWRRFAGIWARYWPTYQPWIGTGARVVLGVVWLIAGFAKVGDLAESGRAVAAYRLLPYDLATFLGAVLPFVEIGLGLLLLAGLAVRLSGAVSGVLQLMFLVGIVSAWARGLRIDCGCFGGGGDLAAGESTKYLSETLRDLGLLTLSGFLVLFPRTRFSVEGKLLDVAPAPTKGSGNASRTKRGAKGGTR